MEISHWKRRDANGAIDSLALASGKGQSWYDMARHGTALVIYGM